MIHSGPVQTDWTDQSIQTKNYLSGLVVEKLWTEKFSPYRSKDRDLSISTVCCSICLCQQASRYAQIADWVFSLSASVLSQRSILWNHNTCGVYKHAFFIQLYKQKCKFNSRGANIHKLQNTASLLDVTQRIINHKWSKNNSISSTNAISSLICKISNN